MGALVGSRHNPVLGEFYRRLLAAGKAKKQMPTACMRKLLIILNATGAERSTLEPTRCYSLKSKTVAPEICRRKCGTRRGASRGGFNNDWEMEAFEANLGCAERKLGMVRLFKNATRNTKSMS